MSIRGQPRISEGSHKECVQRWGKAKKVVALVRVTHNFHALTASGAGDVDQQQLEPIQTLGSGTFGDVKLYRWKEGATQLVNGLPEPRAGVIAVKTLHEELGGEQALREFQYEIEILRKLKHSHIAGFLGSGAWVCEETKTRTLYAAMEAVMGGDLEEAILAQDLLVVPSYNDADVLRWAHELSKALHYLHTRQPLVIHRDIKPENVLLDDSWSVKLADFGLSKLVRRSFNSDRLSPGDIAALQSCASFGPIEDVENDGDGESLPENDHEHTYEMSGAGSYVYIAPEAFRREKINEKVDQFSFAVVLWEVMSRRPLLRGRTHASEDQKPGEEEEACTPLQWAQDVSALGVRPEIPAHWPEIIRDLVRECWAADSAARPSFRVIQSALAKHQRVSEWTDPATVSWVLKPQVGADGEVIADGRAAPAAAAVDDVLLSLSALAESPTPAPPVSRTSAELERRRTMVRAASRAHLRIPVLDDEEGKKKEPQCACSIQ